MSDILARLRAEADSYAHKDNPRLRGLLNQAYEGSDAKPADKCHNRWRARECERSLMIRFREPLIGE